MTSPDNAGGPPERPLLRVVRGEPTPEELAALVAVLTARAAAPGPGQPPPVSGWTDRARLVRPAVVPSPGGWRASGWPR